MLKSKLTFEKKFLAKNEQICSGNRTYIDFNINGISLAELIGDVGKNIGKFGWDRKVDFELSELKELRESEKSRLENGLFSIYVCAECGDEGCGAIMFEKYQTDEIVEWKNFVWSDGYDDEEETAEKIDLKTIIFKRAEYERAMEKLKTMITGK
ncbi:hypothetical protein MG296_14310 [Flavobacteriaceae bacterium TK19130]|nr:hypothetical protein [Thermobacterium salinum]